MMNVNKTGVPNVLVQEVVDLALVQVKIKKIRASAIEDKVNKWKH